MGRLLLQKNQKSLSYWENRFALRQNLSFLIEIQAIQLLQLLVLPPVGKFASASGKSSFYMYQYNPSGNGVTSVYL